MYLYWAKKQKLFDSDLGEYISFGISVWDLRTGTNPILFIPDVSTDGKAVVNLAIRCTLGRLDSDQLMDVVEDFCKNRHPSSICTLFEHHPAGI